MTTEELQAKLDDMDDGVLRSGSHTAGGREFCALEFKSQVDGIPWTDNPVKTGMPDLRPLNDASWPSDKARTEALLPVLAALWNYASWSDARKARWLEIVLVEITNRWIITLPWFVQHPQPGQATITTKADVTRWAVLAAGAAWTAGAAEAALAAGAVLAAGAALTARAAGAGEAVLPEVGKLWIRAAEETEGL
jgi:hypothetical protein